MALIGPQLFLHPPFAQDDLLRNVVAFAWGFDYQKLYSLSSGVPSFDPYLGFDWLLGHLTQLTNPRIAVHTAQLVGAGLLLASIAAPLVRYPDAGFRVSFALFGALASLVTSRLVAGRPEVLATVWLLSAAALPPRKWLGLGLLLSPAYWLMPLYAVGGFLLSGSWRKKVSYVMVGAVGASLFWLGYAQGAWVRAVNSLSSVSAHRAVAAVEAAPLSSLGAYPGTWVLLLTMGLALITFRQRIRHLQWWAAAGLFLSVGVARHILVLAPLAAIWVASQNWPRPRLGHWCSLTLLAVICAVLAMQQLPEESGPDFVLPPNSFVLTGYNKGIFYLPFSNPGTIRLAPSIEPAWDSSQVAELAQAVAHGTLTCEQLKGLPFTHVVTSEQAVLQGDCFKKTKPRGEWVLWDLR